MTNKTYGKIPNIKQTKVEVWISPEILYWLKHKCSKHERIEEIILKILEEERNKGVPTVEPSTFITNYGNGAGVLSPGFNNWQR